ncbi:hypothetical protein RRG08_049131 [Elysia crispata]|uniref:Uncharacterized protein n=1 Tax=Elysia crispata TaxID=231223 RepID=A0AAE1CZY1_9GAST|nr:hypothetical protein RRG08_049131 [Elysia crispata]
MKNETALARCRESTACVDFFSPDTLTRCVIARLLALATPSLTAAVKPQLLVDGGGVMLRRPGRIYGHAVLEINGF